MKINTDTKKNSVSFIVVNWNGKNLLNECLSSILQQSYKDFEVILVDNGSTDDSINYVKANFPCIKTMALEHNMGFTGGNIEGLKRATGDFIALINNDALLVQNWLQFMIDAMNDNERIGICSSKILIEGTDRIDSAGDAFTTAFTGTKIGEKQKANMFSERKYVPGACAAAVLYRRKMIEEIGFLDENFFLNHEDTDLNMRAWLSGWKCIFVPEAIVYHKVSASIGNLSDTAVYYFARNNEWVWIKNVPINLMIRYLPHRIIYEISSFCFFCIIKGKWSAFLKGKVDSIRKLPLMIKKRKSFQKKIRLKNEEIKKELMPILSYLLERFRNLKNAEDVKTNR